MLIQTDKQHHLRASDRFFHWIQKGVPLRIEIGMKEVSQNNAVLVRRDTREKIVATLDSISKKYKNPYATRIKIRVCFRCTTKIRKYRRNQKNFYLLPKISLFRKDSLENSNYKQAQELAPTLRCVIPTQYAIPKSTLNTAGFPEKIHFLFWISSSKIKRIVALVCSWILSAVSFVPSQ